MPQFRWGVRTEDGSRWAVFGECKVHALIGAAEGQNVVDAHPLVGVVPIESDDFYAGVDRRQSGPLALPRSADAPLRLGSANLCIPARRREAAK